MFEIRLRWASVWPARPISEVRRQALRRGQAGPFADQQHHHGRIEQVTNIVEDADTTVPHDDRPAKAPAAFACLRFQQRQQRRHLLDDGRHREAVADDHLHVGLTRAICRDCAVRRFTQPTAEVGTHQVFGLVACLGLHLEKPPALNEIAAEVVLQIQLGMNGVEGRRMVAAQVELGGGQVRRSGATCQDACRRANSDGL